MPATSFDFVILTVCGWINRRQLPAIEYLREENRVLLELLGNKRPPLSNAQRRRLAEKGKALGRKVLAQLASIATPETIPTWGYTRIAGAMMNLGHDVSRMTVALVLAENGIAPAPERTKGMSWREFLRIHWEGLTATDFFTVESLESSVSS